MKHHKLPFNISLERKYNEINIEKFINDWIENQNKSKIREISIDNDLHIEIGKFKTYDINISEIIDLGMRYSLGKHEFRKLVAEIIDIKKQKLFNTKPR